MWYTICFPKFIFLLQLNYCKRPGFTINSIDLVTSACVCVWVCVCVLWWWWGGGFEGYHLWSFPVMHTCMSTFLVKTRFIITSLEFFWMIYIYQRKVTYQVFRVEPTTATFTEIYNWNYKIAKIRSHFSISDGIIHPWPNINGSLAYCTN